MRLTNRKTGKSFNLSPKEIADFFYAKNAKGEYINDTEEYSLKDNSNEISTFKFFLGCLGLIALVYGSFYLFLQFNY